MVRKAGLRVVLDTNVIVSAIVYGGQPKKVLDLVIGGEIMGTTSEILSSELYEVLTKKFDYGDSEISTTKKGLDEMFAKVRPKISLDIVRDVDDNRVIEAAIEGNCDFVITGDKDLLNLKVYNHIKIVTVDEFLQFYN